MNMVSCRYCGRQICETDRVCPHCSALQYNPATGNGSATIYNNVTSANIKKEITERTNHPFIQSLGLFALIYIALLFLAGLAKTYLSFNISSFIILITACAITSQLLAKKVHRYITKKEILLFSLGAFSIDILINWAGAFFIIQKPELITTAWAWLILLLDFMILLAQFWYLPNRYFKYIEANEKKTHDKSSIRKNRITLAVVIFISALTMYGFLFSNFLPNSNYSETVFYIIIISTVVSTIYLNRIFSLRLNDPEFQQKLKHPSFSKIWVRIFCFGILTMGLSLGIFGKTIPCLYTDFLGSEGDLLVIVTGWSYGGKSCSHPEVNDQVFLVPERGLCVNSADRKKYTNGTTLRLRGKISALGINISQMEILPDYCKEGLADIKAGKYQLAIEDLSEAISIKKDYAEAYLYRGSAYAKLNNYTQAIEDYNRTIEIKPDCAEAYNNRGGAYNSMGNHKQAIEDFSRAIEIKPDHAKAYNNRGVAYISMGNHKQAIEDFSRAIEIEPDYARAYSNRGGEYSDLGNYMQAIEDCNKAIEIKPDYAEFYNKRGVIYLGRGNRELGCPDAQKACALGNCELLEAAKKRRLCR